MADEPDDDDDTEGRSKTAVGTVATPKDAGESGSVDVALSGTAIPEAVPEPVDARSFDSQPVSSGRVRAVAGVEKTSPTRKLRDGAKDAVTAGLTTVGGGIELVGGVVEKIGDVTSKVPLVGASVSTIGVGITTVGESIAELPRVARTRRGRVLLRSMFVGYLVVVTWLTAIVGWQLHNNDPTDFRPDAEAILVQLSAGPASVDAVYDDASPRFQEVVRKERFELDMADQLRTIGKFREITAVNDTLLTNGPTGRVGRVSLTVSYEKAICRGSVSFHYDEGRWKLLGVGIELPPELRITKADRVGRLSDPECADPMNSKDCDLHVAALAVLTQLRDGKIREVYDHANEVFRKESTFEQFRRVQEDRIEEIGHFKRFVAVTEAQLFTASSAATPDGESATFDAIGEYEHSVARTVFTFVRAKHADPWQLRMLKVVLPMPRPGDKPTSSSPPAPPAPATPKAGSAR